MDYSFNSINLESLKSLSIDTNNTNVVDNINNYDKVTSETYRIKRLYKVDPLTDKTIPEKLIFEYPYKWNPYTGEKLDLDEIGPLCFNALDLYQYYFKNRCNGLWNPPVDNYQGYYGELIGTGKDIYIKSRGNKPEKYLFRIPIIDCYLPQNHNLSVITMGPLLTDDDIDKIDSIIKNNNIYKKSSLKQIKNYYDNALEQNPDPSKLITYKNQYPDFSDSDITEKYNRNYVDILKNLLN